MRLALRSRALRGPAVSIYFRGSASSFVGGGGAILIVAILTLVGWVPGVIAALIFSGAAEAILSPPANIVPLSFFVLAPGFIVISMLPSRLTTVGSR